MKRAPDWLALATPPVLGALAAFLGNATVLRKIAAESHSRGGEVLATEIRRALYRVDLSVLVSKFIGETAKNLHRFFDAATPSEAVLATNLQNKLDQELSRRFRHVVESVPVGKDQEYRK